MLQIFSNRTLREKNLLVLKDEKEKKAMKRILSLGLAALMTVFALAGCGADSNDGGTGTGRDAISVLTREEGSGTRGARGTRGL